MSIEDVISLVADAEYDGIEVWIRDIRQFTESGRPLSELKRRLDDVGLEPVNAIGFAQWIVDDDQRRAKGMEDMKRDMDLFRQIGGRRIAAPPAGAREPLDLFKMADRYAALLEIGAKTEVTPQLELWGPSQSLSRLGQLVFVAAECGRTDARLLPDVYHIYRGGSDFAGLRYINGQMLDVFHVNDYPSEPPRDQLTDADRIFPGDGAAPLGDILRTIHSAGFQGMLSLELFNREYWKRDPLAVAKSGLRKMKTAVEQAFA